MREFRDENGGASAGEKEEGELGESLVLDLADPGPHLRRLTDEIAPSVIAELEPVYEQLARSNAEKVPWLLSSLCSRNAMMSPLIDRVCTIRAVERYLEGGPLVAGGALTLDCDDAALVSALKKRLAGLPLRLSVRRRRLSAQTSRWLKIRLGAVLMIARRFLAWMSEGGGSSRCDADTAAPMTVLEAFHVRGGEEVTPAEQPYENRYFGRLDSLVDARRREALRYWLTPAGFPDNGKAFQELKRRSSHRLINPDRYLRLSDWLRLCWAPIVVAFNRLPSVTVGDLCLDGLLRSEKWSRALSADWMIGYLYYLAIGRMKESGRPIEVWIDWYENQPVDKGALLAIREHYPGVHVRGHRGCLPWPLTQAYAHPQPWEAARGLTPDELLLPSRVLTEELGKSHPHLRIGTCPGFRFEGVTGAADVPTSMEAGPRGEILLALPIGEAQARSILNIFGRLVRDHPEYEERMVVRPHPSHAAPKIRNWLASSGIGDEVFAPSTTLRDDLARCRVMVSAASTACVEALLMGKRLLVVGPAAGITPLPIPLCFDASSWSVVYDAESAYTQMESWLSEMRTAEQGRRWKGDDFFEAVSTENIERFLETPAEVEEAIVEAAAGGGSPITERD